ncbi:MAG: aminotransferase class I/II-fold pyridoxal phosphate-dependent enzyme [Candidatus Thorarchaeota archaeon]
MRLRPFNLERIQSEWEHIVKYNLSESGVEPFRIDELLTEEQIAELHNIKLGYTQTNGTEALRAAIAAPYPGAEAGQVIVTNGGAEANFLTAWWLLHENEGRGDISMMIPNYLQMQGVWAALGGNVRPFHLRVDKGRWALDIEELKSTITRETVAIALCNPNNPTGSVLTEGEMRAVADIAQDRGLWIISDEVYQGAELSGGKTPTMFDRHDRVLVNSSLSKAFGLPGLRLGWSVTPSAEVAGELWAYSDYTTICPTAISDWMATIALQPEKRAMIERRTRTIIRNNWQIMSTWLDRHGDVFDYVAPSAAAICFPRADLDMTTETFVQRLMKEKSVLVPPGEHFDMPGFIRFGYGSDPEYLKEGLSLVSEFLAEI